MSLPKGFIYPDTRERLTRVEKLIKAGMSVQEASKKEGWKQTSTYYKTRQAVMASGSASSTTVIPTKKPRAKHAQVKVIDLSGVAPAAPKPLALFVGSAADLIGVLRNF